MRYQIHRYPADMIDVAWLDGHRVVIRPVLPQDAPLTAAFFGNLTAHSRYDRFMSPMRELPPSLLERLTHVDYADHLALVAELFEGDKEIVVAEARYVRPAGTGDAEFAVSVADQWQGKGLASLLLAKLLCRARFVGIERIVGETLATNERMMHLARKAGFTLRHSPDTRGVVLMEKPLEATQPRVPCDSARAEDVLAA
jgi:acetyltransferase